LRESKKLTHWSENPAISDFLGRMPLAAFTSVVAGALMNWIAAVSENHSRKALLLLSGMLSLLMASPAPAKLATDFDPNLDFSSFKTFAFIGGFEPLVRMQLTQPTQQPDPSGRHT
jgi:hypothetical protein